ncbi:helix-turn-helix transcriptional regulator, LuxR family [Desulfuromonas soudanensis]|uniref:Helix-turn-helix transcriptional regulator, LuxR family n=1 Tax=Desulfuromonas soudanensis TaxID=1603606 RepID=A0A0M4D693_9BACT|nr:response regulator transcription factor [Desulfuromonas soudanensis]ALC16435.1 helix-turn-helix transcriptional regulator, LuxR family [Desulfuromonas soudanensis]
MRVLVEMGNRLLGEALCCLINNRFDGYSAEIRGQWPVQPVIDFVILDCKTCRDELFSEYKDAKFILIDNGLEENNLSCLLLTKPVDGVISPDMASDLLPKALLAIARGEGWIDHERMKSLLGHSRRGSNVPELARLSEADRGIVEMIVLGRRNREIAEALCLSEQTIKTHVSRIYRTLNVSGRTHLVFLVMKNR